jgi:hypothetical protein
MGRKGGVIMEYVIIYRDKKLDIKFKAVPKDYSYADIKNSEVLSVVRYDKFMETFEQFRKEANETE